MAFTLNPSVALPYGEGSQFTPNDSNGIVNYASGYFVMDGTTPVAVQIPVGFHPRKIRVIDVTGGTLGTQWEYVDFLNDAIGSTGHTIKTVTPATPVVSIDATGIITIGTDAAGTERTFTVSAAALTASHSYIFEATA